MARVGTVRAILEERKIEWEIADFLRLEKRQYYHSPYFNFCGVSGCLCICLRSPNCTTPSECVRLTFVLTSMPEHRARAEVTLGFKTVDGESYLEFTQVFTKPSKGLLMYITRSKLIERQSDLLPSGTLTVICTFEKDSDANAASERQFLEASSQTEEGAGVYELQQHLREISRNGEMSDVILKAGDREFKVHRCILAARSPVFSAMMKTKMRETVTSVVDIQDVDPHILSHFLDYLYTGSTKCLTSENVTKLYTAADKYQVDLLKEICLDHMLMNVSVENFCEILMLSVQHNEEKLKEICIQFFAKHSSDIIKTCEWQTLLRENPILCDELHITHLQLIKKN